jgi:hypothetical protein
MIEIPQPALKAQPGAVQGKKAQKRTLVMKNQNMNKKQTQPT